MRTRPTSFNLLTKVKRWFKRASQLPNEILGTLICVYKVLGVIVIWSTFVLKSSTPYTT